MPQDVPRYAAENLLSQTRVGICAHGQKVAVELFGRRQQTSADYVVDWFEHLRSAGTPCIAKWV